MKSSQMRPPLIIQHQDFHNQNSTFKTLQLLKPAKWFILQILDKNAFSLHEFNSKVASHDLCH